MSLETHTPGSGTGHSQTPVNSLMTMSNARSAEASAHIELNILEVFFRTHTHTAAWSVAQLVLLFQTSCLLNFLESGTSVCALPPNPLSLSLLCRLPTHSLYFHY